jgi:hypothetical protein
LFTFYSYDISEKNLYGSALTTIIIDNNRTVKAIVINEMR